MNNADNDTDLEEDSDLEEIVPQFPSDENVEEELGTGPETGQERAEKAVENALAKDRTYRTADGTPKKVHNISDQVILIWQQLMLDDRGGEFNTVSLLWLLLLSPKRVLKVGAQPLSALKEAILLFQIEEKDNLEGESYNQLEKFLMELLAEAGFTQVTPDDSDDEGKP